MMRMSVCMYTYAVIHLYVEVSIYILSILYRGGDYERILVAAFVHRRICSVYHLIAHVINTYHYKLNYFN